MRWEINRRRSRLREATIPPFTRSTSFFPKSLVQKVTSLCPRQTEGGIALPVRSTMSILMPKSLLYLIRCRTRWLKRRHGIILLWRNTPPRCWIRLISSQALLPPAYPSIRRFPLSQVLCSRYLRSLLIPAPRPYHSPRLRLYRQNIHSAQLTMRHHDKLTRANFLLRLSYSWRQAASYS